MTTTDHVYCTPLDVRNMTDKVLDDSDAEIEQIALAVTDWLDRTTNRIDGYAAPTEPTPRTYAGSGQTVQIIDQCIEITEVAVKISPTDTGYAVWAADAWFPFQGQGKLPDLNHLPYNGLMTTAGNGYLFTESLFGNTMRGFNDYRWSPTAFRRVPTVKVTARWAYSENVPPAIKQACIIETARIYKMGTSFYADALANADLGRLILLNGIHPTTKILLDGLKRIPI